MLAQYLKAFFITLACFSVGILSGVVVAEESQQEVVDPYDGFYTFSMNLHRIQNNYIEVIPTRDLIYNAISGMMTALDEHSMYFPPEEYEQFKSSRETWSVGVGIQMNNERVITDVLPQGPAAVSGLRVGDQLSKINDASIENWSLSRIHEIFKQKKGTQIKIEVLRSFEPIETTLTIDEIQTPNHQIHEIEPGYYYIAIKRFSGDVGKVVIGELTSLKKGSAIGIKGLILDLRNNPGGNVLDGIALTDAFLKEGHISTLSYRDEKRNQRYDAVDKIDDFTTEEIVVLINSGSASAAELVAGALQFNKRATIVGTPSFGKGSVQKLYTSDNEALKLTVGQFTAGDLLVSKNNPIQPDVLIEPIIVDPKRALRELIEQSSLSKREKENMLIPLSQLPARPSSVSIPWHTDMNSKMSQDPMLVSAWTVLQQ